MTVATNTVGRRKVSSLALERSGVQNPEIAPFTPIYAREPTRRGGVPKIAWMLVPTIVIAAGLTAFVLSNPRTQAVNERTATAPIAQEAAAPSMAPPVVDAVPLSVAPAALAAESAAAPVVVSTRRASPAKPRLAAPLTNRSSAELPQAPMAYDGNASSYIPNPATVPPEIPNQPADPAPSPVSEPQSPPDVVPEVKN